MPVATPDSSTSSWQEVTVPVRDSEVAQFFASFGAWLGQATAAAPASLPELTPEALKALWIEKLPPVEKEILCLLSDDYGRPVGWPELKRKLLLAGKPSLSRDFPVLTKACAGPPPAMFPVRQEGKDDDAVFWLPAELGDAVRAIEEAHGGEIEGGVTRTSENPSNGAS